MTVAPSPSSSGTATMREAVARLVDPDAHYNDIPDVRWAKTDLQRRELAYQKADAIIGLFPSPTPQIAGDVKKAEQIIREFISNRADGNRARKALETLLAALSPQAQEPNR